MKLELILGNVVLFSLLISFAFALLMSMYFLGGFSDVVHVVEHASFGNVDQDVRLNVMSTINYGVLFLVFPIVGIVAFAVERRWELERSFGLLFFMLGILSVLWGAFHLWNASNAYSRGITLADQLNVANLSGPLSTIYGAYALIVGLPWILTGVLLLVFAYKDWRV